MANHHPPQRERWAWYLYDFGNSAYAAVVLLAVYAAYFKGQVVGGARGSWLWGLSVGIAMFVVAVTSPVLGAIADFSGSKKRFLLFFTSMACTFTGLLFFARQGTVFIGMLFFILAEIGYRSAQVFYNSLLPEVSTPEDIGRVSGTGWAIGSAGGILCLLIILPLIMFIEGTLIVRASLLITALFFAGFAIPIFRRLEERTDPQPLPDGASYLTIGFKRLWETIKRIKHFREFAKFVIAFLIYNDGIMMALNFAGIIGAVLFGMDQQQLIIFMIVAQVTSIGGAFFAGLIADWIGTKRSLLLHLLLMISVVTWMFFVQTLTQFFLIGALAGFALTGVQSVSRTAVASFSPSNRNAEFYGFFAIAGRTSSFIGPTVYGWIAAWAANFYMQRGQGALLAEQNGQRLAILSINLFLLVGLIFLLAVNEKKAMRAASSPPEEIAA
ncbi:MAG: MFS transporter [Chloroflexota bacterium]|nr:MFS transporter [Chloroflexota bacterium]